MQRSKHEFGTQKLAKESQIVDTKKSSFHNETTGTFVTTALNKDVVDSNDLQLSANFHSLNRSKNK